jgi:LmbE family N-acetylglucosaminyl deacetylase
MTREQKGPSGEKLHVVAVGAHIHDAEVMAGHLIALYTSAGHRGTLVHATPGEKGSPTLPPDEYRPVKLAEARRTARRLGADVRFLPYEDAALPLDHDARLRFAALFRELRPDLVFTHWRGSFHPDHWRTHCLVMDGLRLAADAGVKIPGEPHRTRWVFFPENWEDMTDFHPEILVDISPVYDRWHAAMMEQGLFRGEVSRFRYREYYEGLSSVRGARAWTQTAVALMRSPLSADRQSRLPDWLA